MGKSAPAPSNYTNTANAQAAASQGNVNAQTNANRANINGTTTSQQWSQGPDGKWTMNAGFGGAGGIGSELTGQAQAAFAQPLDNGSAARQQTIDSAFGQAQRRLDPQWAQNDQLQQSQLANQGIDPNSAAAQASNRQFSNNRNDAYSGAMNSAIHEGNQAGSDVFRNNMMAQNNPLQQLLALSGQQGPSYNQAGQAETPQLLAATMGQDAAARQAYQDQQKQITDAIGAGGQLLGGIGKMFAF